MRISSVDLMGLGRCFASLKPSRTHGMGRGLAISTLSLPSSSKRLMHRANIRVGPTPDIINFPTLIAPTFPTHSGAEEV